MECSFKANFKKALSKEFYLHDTVQVAQMLLGKVISRSVLSAQFNDRKGNVNSNIFIDPDQIHTSKQYISGRIVECEAYLNHDDIASHSRMGKTKRNIAMFGDGGIIYVYKIYGIHHCLNIVTESEGKGCAVLLRALEPLSGIEQMKQNREIEDISNLCRGPGNLARAFNFDVNDNFSSLLTPELFVENNLLFENEEIGVSRRIGTNKEDNLFLRFYLKGNKWVSKYNK